MWLITDTSPERPASAAHRTEGGGKACGTGLHSGSDLKMDASKALGLGYGREVLFVRNLHKRAWNGQGRLPEGGRVEGEAEGEQDLHWKRERKRGTGIEWTGKEPCGGPGSGMRQGTWSIPTSQMEGRCVHAREWSV